MLIMKAETKKEYLPRKTITCPKCGAVEVYYNYPPWNCEECTYTFGRVEQLIRNIKVRKHYFKKGEVD